MSPEFKTTLLREKFVLRDPAGDLSDTPPVVALSNRMVLALTSDVGEPSETYVIRTQNMHSCVRLGAAIAKEYFDRGTIMERITPFRWGNVWRDVTKGYEKDWNPDIWVAIYHKGRPVFEEGERHPFLDIIEKCDVMNHDSYDASVAFAEQAFRQAGKEVKIDHSSNVALIVSIKDYEAKCGIILRGAHRKTTFNYTAKVKKMGGEDIRIPTILTVSAAFLEGVQLAFMVGATNKKRSLELIDRYSDEDRKGKRGAERLVNLAMAIEGLERKYDVQYRPERPDFQEMVRDAENFTLKSLGPQIRAKRESGDLLE